MNHLSLNHDYRSGSRLITLLAGLLFSFSLIAAEKLPENFHRVSNELYRSAQPSAEGMRALEKAGIRTVLNLRQWHSDNQEAKDTALILYRVSINTAAFQEEEIVEALQILHRAVKPALVHCWHGSDRTGLIVSLYRMVFENAKKADVLAELRDPIYGHHEMFYPNIGRYIENVNVDVLRQKVLYPVVAESSSQG